MLLRYYSLIRGLDCERVAMVSTSSHSLENLLRYQRIRACRSFSSDSACLGLAFLRIIAKTVSQSNQKVKDYLKKTPSMLDLSSSTAFPLEQFQSNQVFVSNFQCLVAPLAVSCPSWNSAL